MTRRLALSILFLLLLPSALPGEDWGFDPEKLGLRVPDALSRPEIIQTGPDRAAPPEGGTALPGRDAPAVEYDLDRMRQMNPDFTTYPGVNGVVWLKQSAFVRGVGGGVERTDLRVILGRRGLDEGWLTWRVADPAGGSAEVLEAGVYSPDTGRKLRDVRPVHDADAGLHTVSFTGLPDTFVLVLAWRQSLPGQLTLEGLCGFASEEGRAPLPVWESIVEVTAPAAQELAYRAFPENARPEVQEDEMGSTLTWRRINVEPPAGGLIVSERPGVAFSARRGEAALLRLMRDAGAVTVPPAPAAALEGFRKSQENGVTRLLSWLQDQPEVLLAEGMARTIPRSAPWTREEKLTLALVWLREQGVEASPFWRLPVEAREDPPACPGLLQGPLLELPVLKGSRRTSETFFYDMGSAPVMGVTPPLLRGARIAGLSSAKLLVQRQIPAGKAADNRLSAVMDLKMDAQGALSGRVRVMLRGAWGPLLLPREAGDGALRGVVSALFPELQNYGKAQLRSVKGVPELSFELEGKPGVGGSGQGVLAIPPAFVPAAFLALEREPAPVRLRFPFILDQTLNIDLPKGTERVLISGNADRSPGKVKFSESYTNRRHRLVAEARFEAGSASVPAGDLALFRQNMGRWRNFSSRHIPVQVRASR